MDEPVRPAADKGPLIRLEVLGRVSATVDGVEVDLGGPKQRAVVALPLLARGAVVPADRLIDSLWGDDPPPSAAEAMQEAGEGDLRAAVDLLARTSARLEHAKALYSLGTLPGVPPEESLRLLCHALELADLCGATHFRRDIAAALAEVGVEVPAEPSGALTLTSTERRMLCLDAEGADVKTIAQALFLAPRTVELTLESVRDRVGGVLDAVLAVS